ncbi:flagellar hook-basal body protein [Ramlibacter sp. G-1-2-2]|uniref:Flagellar hook-basal body protein n=1 Tax=Ramlibacter agri TaxID=2728837 RepID=A0A848GWC9_9BURK|nr:flagellar hook-basal body protein [Ramlibacter agri]NML42915.1 flagellar hook-basal body protein [Ramlibacter agri]
MDSILALSLEAMQAGMARMDRAGMNLANAQTAGYKREVMLANFAQRLQPADGAAAPAATAVHLDLRQGTMQTTGQSLDLALSGPAWFEVATAQGNAYTRMGNFRRDAQGRLVTAQGQPVLGTSGEITLPDGIPVIDVQGRIFESVAGAGQARLRGEPVAQLRLVAFEDGAVSHRLGDGLVAFDGSPRLADGETEVRQGYLENSNVRSADEMVQLLQTLRHFESMQKVALAYDEMLSNALRKLADNP